MAGAAPAPPMELRSGRALLAALQQPPPRLSPEQAAHFETDDRANAFEDGVLAYFVEAKQGIFQDELEDQMAEALETDFNTQAQDGSLREIAGSLFKLFGECARGDFSTVAALTAARLGAGAAQCVREGGAGQGWDGMESSSSDEDEDEGGGGGGDGAEPMDAEVGAPPAEPARGRPPPEVDADGFISVPARRKR